MQILQQEQNCQSFITWHPLISMWPMSECKRGITRYRNATGMIHLLCHTRKYSRLVVRAWRFHVREQKRTDSTEMNRKGTQWRETVRSAGHARPIVWPLHSVWQNVLTRLPQMGPLPQPQTSPAEWANSPTPLKRVPHNFDFRACLWPQQPLQINYLSPILLTLLMTVSCIYATAARIKRIVRQSELCDYIWSKYVFISRETEK